MKSNSNFRAVFPLLTRSLHRDFLHEMRSLCRVLASVPNLLLIRLTGRAIVCLHFTPCCLILSFREIRQVQPREPVISDTEVPPQWQKQCEQSASILSSTVSPFSILTLRNPDIRNRTGPATSLFINPDTPKPKPKPTDAIVKIKCFGLNRMDLLQREGHYPVPPQAPKTLGVEFSGTIESFGSDAEEEFKMGEEVYGLAYGGAYAEYIAVSTKMLMHKPWELSWEQAAGVPEVCRCFS